MNNRHGRHADSSTESSTESATSSSAGGDRRSASAPRREASAAGASGTHAGSGVESVVDRRSGLDRRLTEQGTSTHLERRRGPGRRLSDFVRDAEEGQLSQEQFMFLMAIEAFKRVNGKTFPSWTDVLEVIRKLGYRKTMSSELNLGGRAEDWLERADAPSRTTPADANVTPPTRRSAA